MARGKEILEKSIIRTGNSSTIKHLKAVTYFDTLAEQCHYICDRLSYLRKMYEPDYFAFESLSFGSFGNAEKDLASLFGAIQERLLNENTAPNQIMTFTPQTVKSFARKLLPRDEQFMDTTDKKGNPKKLLVKMDKKLIVKAVTSVLPDDYYKGYKMSGENAGLDDLCDSYLLLCLAQEKLGELNA